MTKPPLPNVRLTITVTPEVHATFQRLASAGGMSISRAMGDWLGDTIEAAQFTAEKMEQARAAPKIVMRELHAYALGLADETGSLMDRFRREGQAARTDAAQRAARAGGTSPPVSNTGGKGSKNTVSGARKANP